jgi:hypothetical protein
MNEGDHLNCCFPRVTLPSSSGQSSKGSVLRQMRSDNGGQGHPGGCSESTGVAQI